MPGVAEELSKVIKFSTETKTTLRLQFEELEQQVFIIIIKTIILERRKTINNNKNRQTVMPINWSPFIKSFNVYLIL